MHNSLLCVFPAKNDPARTHNCIVASNIKAVRRNETVKRAHFVKIKHTEWGVKRIRFTYTFEVVCIYRQVADELLWAATASWKVCRTAY